MTHPDEQAIVINFERPMPVFPLPETVLLPHGALPLHVFEPRYRRMVHDALDGSGLICMGLFAREVGRREYTHGRPPLRPNVCVGYCHQYEKLADGRYLVLLRGLCRARIVEEVDHEPYRLVRLRPTELEPADEQQLRAQRYRLENLLSDPTLDRVEPVRDLRPLLERTIPTAALIDITISQLFGDPEQRYEMLGETDARRRGRWLTARLRKLSEAGGATGGDSAWV